MTAFNVVRFRVKPGREEQFVNAHREAEANFPGMRRVALVKTGERTYCVIGEWEDTASLAGAREQMISPAEPLPGHAGRPRRRAWRHRPGIGGGGRRNAAQGWVIPSTGARPSGPAWAGCPGLQRAVQLAADLLTGFLAPVNRATGAAGRPFQGAMYWVASGDDPAIENGGG